MLVVLIQPRTPSAALDYRYRGEHLGLSSLVAVLKRAGHRALQLDDALDRRNLADTLLILKALRPDLVGVTVPAQTAAGTTISYIEAIRKTLPQTPTCTGGIFATVAHEEFMRRCPSIDFLLRGEGEETMPKLLDALGDEQKLSQVAGLSYRRSNGDVVHNPLPPLVDVTKLPPVDRSSIGPLIAENRRVALYAGRGCYGECSFCSLHAFWGARCVRKRSPESVVEEMISLSDMGVRKLRFIDDIFLDSSKESKRWLDRFENLLQAEQRSFNLWMQFRAQDVDKEMLKRLKKLGLKKMLIGVESGDQKSLDAMKKHTDVAQNIEAVEKAIAAGVNEVAIGFIMFHPDSTFESIGNNLEFLARMPTFRYKNLFSKASAYAGTAMYAKIVDEGLEIPGENWYDVCDYYFVDSRVQQLWDYSRRLRIGFAHGIWFETALDVEERFLKGSRIDYPAKTELHALGVEFRAMLSQQMLERFQSIFYCVGNGLFPEQDCFEMPSELLELINRIQVLLPIAQQQVGLPTGYNMPEETLEDILKL